MCVLWREGGRGGGREGEREGVHEPYIFSVYAIGACMEKPPIAHVKMHIARDSPWARAYLVVCGWW